MKQTKMRRGEKMTLQKLAKLAGVSVSTVSKAFSDSREISVETKEQILSLAKRHGCFEKYYKGKFGKQLVAVICPEIRGEFYADFAADLNDKIEARGGMMMLSVSGFSAEREEDLIRYYGSFGHADGIIFVSGSLRLKTEPNIPVVQIGGKYKTEKADYIDIDIASGIDQAVEYLKANGHRKIGYIGETLTASKHRLFCEAMRKNALRLEEAYMVNSKMRFQMAGFDAMKQLMEQKDRPTAVIAAYDYMAMGALRYTQEAGLSIPKDVSVIGMNNVSAAAYLDVPLTTIVSHPEELCETAVDLIFKKMDNQFYFARQDITLKSRLIVRDSVANLNGSSEPSRFCCF